MIKAVLDTNVLVSALLSGDGVPNKILRLAGPTYQLFICQEIMEEAREVLLRPRIQKRISLNKDKVNAFLSTIQKVAKVMEDLPSLQVIDDDPDDNVILACALKANADYLVSGDIHLKQLGRYEGVPIVSPSEFLAIIG